MPSIDFANILLRVISTLGWTLLGVIIFYLGMRLYDLLDPIDYHAEIQRGNTAAAIKLGAVMLGLAAITVAAIIS